MKKADRLYFALVIALAMGIVFVAVYKFVLKTPSENKPRIENPGKIAVTSLDGTKTTLTDMITATEETYCLILEIYNCESCIYKGITELAGLEKNGKNCFCLVVHDWPNEVEGWGRHYNFDRFVSIKKQIFYEQFHSPYLPLLIKFVNGKIKSYRYITQ